MRLVRGGCIISVVLAVSSCSDSRPLPSELESGPALSVAESQQVPVRRGPRTLDSRFEEVAAEEPTFGGAYVNEEGRKVIWVTDLTRGSEAEASLATRVPMTRRSAGTERSPTGPIFRRADFSFSELADTRRRLRKIIGSQGVLSLDIDETRNRVVVGVAPNVEASAILNRADAEGALRAQIIVEETFEVVTMAGGRSAPTYVNNLRLDQDFYWGGLQIANDDTPTNYCTLGFIAVPYEETTERVLTASHCSPTMGSVDSGFMGQSSGYASDSFGVEITDPSLITGSGSGNDGGDCSSGQTCRWSDVAVYSVSNTLAKKGTIARTLGWRQWEETTRMRTDADSLFYIDGKADEAAYIGLELEKMGRTSGWTLGEVITTCIDAIGSDNIIRLCSDVIESGTQPGDSGGPVFYSEGDGLVTAYGMVWGGDSISNWHRTVYSPFENIDYEFDPFNIEY